MHGAAPHFQKRREAQINPSGSIESRLGPSAADGRRHTFASTARALQPCLQPMLPFIHSFRELVVLTRPHLAQPLPTSAAGSSVFSSPLGVTVAASQPCEQHARRQLKTVSGLRQVRSLRMLIPVRTTSTSASHIKLFKCNMPKSLRLIALPTEFAEHITNRSEFSLSRLCMMLLPVLPCRHVMTGHCFESSRSAGAAQKGGYRVRDFGGVFTSPMCKWCIFLLCESECGVPEHTTCGNE